MKCYYKPYSSTVIIAIIIISGCNPNMIPLKGNYVASPIEFTSAQSSDSLWLHITQIFAEKGLGVKKVDKMKGLIVSKKTPFISVYSFEDTVGALKEPQAWVVLQKVFIKTKLWNPKTIYGKWSIQISDAEADIKTIKIDSIVICTYSPNIFATVETRGQTTGRLEKLIDSTLLHNFIKVSLN